MYNDFFGFREAPFSIAPDPRYLYLSERHKEALAHLMYGVRGQGGFIVITGEVGTGKTTVCRCFLDSVPDDVDVALILNPKLSARELLASICDELQVAYPAGASIKRLIDGLNRHLLDSYSQGRHTVLVIDEAQNLSPDVLEQLRLLTNLETVEKKLLQIVLLGQPELQEMLAKRELRQLSQRITARYHLEALNRNELTAYLRYRLSVAGSRQAVFLPSALKALYRQSKGIPRLINLLADRSLLGAYSHNAPVVDGRTVRQAAREILGKRPRPGGVGVDQLKPPMLVTVSLTVCVLAIGILAWGFRLMGFPGPATAHTVAVETQLEKPLELDSAAEQAPEPPAANQPAILPGDDLPAVLPAPSPVADPVETIEPVGLLADWSRIGGTTEMAYQSLFHAWGLEYPEDASGTACEFAAEYGLQCLHRQGNWRSLKQMDRPAILKVHNAVGESYHLTLLGVDGESVRVALAGQHHTLSREDVEAQWLGDYTLVWQLPPWKRNPGGNETRQDQWLADSLARIREAYQVPEDQSREMATAPLAEQVTWYQQQTGLIPDGIPGTVTLIRLNSDLDPSLPRLTPATVTQHITQTGH